MAGLGVKWIGFQIWAQCLISDVTLSRLLTTLSSSPTPKIRDNIYLAGFFEDVMS